MASEDAHVVQTVGLTKVFKDFWRRDRVLAVDDLNLEVRRGEVFGLLGPNGSGKSTTIKMLLGLLYPTRGRISIFGRPPTDVAVKSRIGFLPEESYLYRFLNARETLDLYGRIFRLPARVRADRISKLLEMVGLQNEAKRRIGEYSKGMARRIGLAQALINDPDFLILDEPTAGLDPIGIKQIKEVIQTLASKGKTILLSSHLLGDVEDVCDRIMILYGGRQRAAGTIADLLSRHDRTQIITEKLRPATIDRLRKLVREVEDKDILSVGHPSDRLETLFMKTVEEAQAANVASSGARGAGAVADFLGGDAREKTGLVESLVAAAETPAPAPAELSAEEPVRESASDASHAVIEQLSKPVSVAPTDEPRPQPVEPVEPTEREQIETDRSVIDALLNATEEHKSG